jgi:putative ABC transport system permease protein
LLLASCGGALGAILAFALLPALLQWIPADMNVPRLAAARIDPVILLFAALASICSGILFGLAPAWQAFRDVLSAPLNERGIGRNGGSRLGKFIVVAEVALAIVLLIAAGLLSKSLVTLDRVNPGFRTDHLLTVEVHRSMSGDQRPDSVWENWTGFYCVGSA